MKRCPITYEAISTTENYSSRGLKLLSPHLTQLAPLAFSAAEQRAESLTRAGKMSIQGVQPKLSACLKTTAGYFELVDQGGHYILKPQSEYYPELPENEALSMSLAATIGIEVPVHGLLYCKDNSMTYFIKRFDRSGHHNKLAVEDFAQLAQLSRDTKYNSSMERVAKIIATYCSFPKLEAINFFKRTLFNFLIGNEDMHVKNFSLITRGKKITLAPAYDLLNTTIVQPNAKEELALPLNGKKNNLTARDFFEYFATQQLNLNQHAVTEVTQQIKQAMPDWKVLISHSFLSKPLQIKYLHLLSERLGRLGF